MSLSIKKKKELLDLKVKELRSAKDRLRQLKRVRDDYAPSFELERVDNELRRVISLVKQIASDIEGMEIDLYGAWAPKRKRGDGFDSREK